MRMMALVLVALGFFSFTSHGEEVKTNTKPLSEVKKEIEDGKAVLVDVREKDEWDDSHFKGAKSIPLSTLKKDAAGASAGLPKDKPIYTHCMVGKRSEAAAKILAGQGYQVINLKMTYDELGKTFDKTK